jgi:ribonuclease HI
MDLTYALSISPTIFQSEIHAIELCEKHCIKKGIRGTNIIIKLDRKASLKPFDSHYLESKREQNSVTLMWVTRHERNVLNKMANKLAKKVLSCLSLNLTHFLE